MATVSAKIFCSRFDGSLGSYKNFNVIHYNCEHFITKAEKLQGFFTLCGCSIMPPATDAARRRSITTVKPGATFDFVATAANGWNAIVIGKQVGWVSGKYSKVI